jgi:hypothetical protein
VVVNGVDAETKSSYGYGSYSRDHYGYIGHYHDRYSANRAEEVKTTNVVPPQHFDRERNGTQGSAPLTPNLLADAGNIASRSSQTT